MTPTEKLTTELLYVVLRVMKRRKMLDPADRADISTAAQALGLGTNLRERLMRLAEETPMDRENKRETPRQRP